MLAPREAEVSDISLPNDRIGYGKTLTFYLVTFWGRFDFLFERRKKWTLEEISPYVNDLTTDKLDVGALLTKYSRASTQNGVKVFSSRRTANWVCGCTVCVCMCVWVHARVHVLGWVGRGRRHGLCLRMEKSVMDGHHSRVVKTVWLQSHGSMKSWVRISTGVWWIKDVGIFMISQVSFKCRPPSALNFLCVNKHADDQICVLKIL